MAGVPKAGEESPHGNQYGRNPKAEELFGKHVILLRARCLFFKPWSLSHPCFCGTFSEGGLGRYRTFLFIAKQAQAQQWFGLELPPGMSGTRLQLQELRATRQPK